MRWSLILSQYNFFILYLSENQNEKTDALSRCEQDMLTDLSDDKVVNISISVLIQDQNLFSEATDLKQM